MKHLKPLIMADTQIEGWRKSRKYCFEHCFKSQKSHGKINLFTFHQINEDITMWLCLFSLQLAKDKKKKTTEFQLNY